MVETLRKLYLTALVSFFTSGSMVQIVLSLVVSVLACIQQAQYKPFKHQWVNWLQQSSLMVIWATLQSGMLLQVYVNLTPLIFAKPAYKWLYKCPERCLLFYFVIHVVYGYCCMFWYTYAVPWCY